MVKVVGTPGFYDPKARNQEVRTADDWYALAAIYYFLRTGTTLFVTAGSGRQELLQKAGLLQRAGVFTAADCATIRNLVDQTTVVVEAPALTQEAIARRFDTIVRKLMTAKGKRLWTTTQFGEVVDVRSRQHGLAGLLTAMRELGVDVTTKPLLTKVEAQLFPVKRFQDTSMLFGAAGLMKSLVGLMQDGQIAASHDVELENLVAQITRQDYADQWDYATGRAGAIDALATLAEYSQQAKYWDALKKQTAALFDETNDILRYCLQDTDDLTGLGFAHGLTGLGWTLYHVGQLLNVPVYQAKGDELLQVVTALTEDFLQHHALNVMNLSWCEGLAGIGSGLLRAYQTGIAAKAESSKLLDNITDQLVHHFYQQSPALCHGLAGTLAFFNDRQTFQPSTANAEAAELVAEYMTATANDGLIFPDETMRTHVLDYGVGQLGCLAQLHRYIRLFQG
ncbi:lanthionine synthetase LanC family protein [Schleiferilactobacillus shenzhenensis]|uniref:Uncharacterized protein n=1 Tax=Schleiferilactobacillus shenzhenensis LY-73 TaxID=1231336 RepID=U4TK54_9LACO|nr:lanthionine synthetase LanC family protein [Schleiferilactobacillus shenzhenensis]ERL65231.1 hypothetical protein L248_2906 [Schleiferilactobacillus shenzhenensis LY-73]